MGLTVNLMADDKLREEILKVIREQLRPSVYAELAQQVDEKMLTDEFAKAMERLPDRVAYKLASVLEDRFRYDSTFHAAIAKKAAEQLKTEQLRLTETEVERIVTGILRKKFSGLV